MKSVPAQPSGPGRGKVTSEEHSTVLPHPALLPQTHSKTAAKQGKAGSTMRPNKQNARENRRGFENRQNSVFLALPNRIRQSQGFFFKASLRPFSKVASPHFYIVRKLRVARPYPEKQPNGPNEPFPPFEPRIHIFTTDTD